MSNNKKPLSIRFNDEELNFIKNQASINNQSISDFIRDKIFTKSNKNDDQQNQLIKAISLCAGFVETYVKYKFNDEEYQDYRKKVQKILEINGNKF
jgi:hypothetical protein